MTTLAEPNAITEAVVDTEWESLTTEGIEAAQAMDRNRWYIGDLAGKVVGRYGENAIGKYAGEIQVNQKTLEGYERVSGFWTKKSARGAFVNLSWSHYRLAMELGTQSKAFRFLRECSDNSRSVAESVRALRKIQKRPVPPKKLFEGSARVLGFPADYDVLLHGVGAVDLGGFVGRDVRLLIYEVESHV